MLGAVVSLFVAARPSVYERSTQCRTQLPTKNRDLLQGLGRWPARRLPPRLAAERGRLGRADDVLPAARLPRHRARPSRARPLQSDAGRPRDGYLRRRRRRPRTTPRSARRGARRGLDRRREVARHGNGRVAKAALISAVPPIMVKTDHNPGLPPEVFDGFREGTAFNRSQFFLDVASGPFYGFNRPGASVSQGVIWNWWRQGMMGSVNAHYD